MRGCDAPTRNSFAKRGGIARERENIATRVKSIGVKHRAREGPSRGLQVKPLGGDLARSVSGSERVGRWPIVEAPKQADPPHRLEASSPESGRKAGDPTNRARRHASPLTACEYCGCPLPESAWRFKIAPHLERPASPPCGLCPHCCGVLLVRWRAISSRVTRTMTERARARQRRRSTAPGPRAPRRRRPHRRFWRAASPRAMALPSPRRPLQEPSSPPHTSQARRRIAGAG